MSEQQSIVTIKRGRFAPKLQLVRAMLSAASAVMYNDPAEAVPFVDKAIAELRLLKTGLLRF